MHTIGKCVCVQALRFSTLNLKLSANFGFDNKYIQMPHTDTRISHVHLNAVARAQIVYNWNYACAFRKIPQTKQVVKRMNVIILSHAVVSTDAVTVTTETPKSHSPTHTYLFNEFQLFSKRKHSNRDNDRLDQHHRCGCIHFGEFMNSEKKTKRNWKAKEIFRYCCNVQMNLARTHREREGEKELEMHIRWVQSGKQCWKVRRKWFFKLANGIR